MVDLYSDLLAIIAALDAAGVPYAICGAFAVAIHGFVRATTDLDLLVLARDVERAKAAVQPLGFSLPAAPMTFGSGTPTERRVHRVSKIDGEDLVTLDLLEVKSARDEVWSDRDVLEWQQQRVTVVSRAGLIRMKRLAGRDKDMIDIRNLEAGPRDE